MTSLIPSGIVIIINTLTAHAPHTRWHAFNHITLHCKFALLNTRLQIELLIIHVLLIIDLGNIRANLLILNRLCKIILIYLSIWHRIQ